MTFRRPIAGPYGSPVTVAIPAQLARKSHAVRFERFGSKSRLQRSFQEILWIPMLHAATPPTRQALRRLTPGWIS